MEMKSREKIKRRGGKYCRGISKQFSALFPEDRNEQFRRFVSITPLGKVIYIRLLTWPDGRDQTINSKYHRRTWLELPGHAAKRIGKL